MPSIKSPQISLNSIAMEREVSDTEGVFSRRLISNWAELPTTLRRRQKHRPDILNQFTDYSESSENELHNFEPKTFSNVQRIVRRSEFLRKWETTDLIRKDISDLRKDMLKDRKSTPENLFSHLDDDYRKHYVNQDSKLGYRKKSHFISRQEAKSFSDEDRKTNSPDSLLMKSSESELSSDEYGHTDDSGAFLEQASHLDKTPKTERNGFIKFFAKDNCRKKKKVEHDHLDVNKNVRPGSELSRKESFGQQKFDYENIPRIDVSRLDQKSFLNPIVRTSQRQPTIEQLRMEEGCELRSPKNTTALKNAREKKPAQQKQKDEEPKANDMIQEFYDGEQIIMRANGERKMAKMETITEENADGSKLSVREILKRFEDLRTQNEIQAEEKTNDKTLNTIQETLKKLDEKVKSYQVMILIVTFIIIIIIIIGGCRNLSIFKIQSWDKCNQIDGANRVEIRVIK